MGNKDLALVVRRADNSIQRISGYPADKMYWLAYIFFFRRIANLSAGLVARAPTLNQLKELRPPPDGTSARFRQQDYQALGTKIAAFQDKAKITESYILRMRL